jgi:hypothetical protein
VRFGLAIPDPPVQAFGFRDITAFACVRPGVSVGNPPAACFACRSRMAMCDQSAIGDVLQPASKRIDRRPEAPSVNAVNSVSAAWQTVSRLRRINVAISVSVFATARTPPPPDVSTLPTRTSRCRSPSWQPRMSVDSTVTVIANAPAPGVTVAPLRSCSPALKFVAAQRLRALPGDPACGPPPFLPVR